MENEELVLTLRNNDATKQQPFLPIETSIQTMQFTHPYSPFPHHYPTAIPSLSLYPSTPHPEDHTRPPLTPPIIHQRTPQQNLPLLPPPSFLLRNLLDALNAPNGITPRRLRQHPLPRLQQSSSQLSFMLPRPGKLERRPLPHSLEFNLIPFLPPIF